MTLRPFTCVARCATMSDMATSPKSFRMNEHLAPKLTATAKRVDRSESWVINRALELALGGPDIAWHPLYVPNAGTIEP